MFQVEQEAFQFCMVGVQLQIPHFVFEFFVYIEEEEEEGQDCIVWGRIN